MHAHEREANADGTVSKGSAPGHREFVAILPPGCVVPWGRTHGFDPLLVEPDVELRRVEADEPPDLEERDAVLGHETLDVAPGDPECEATASGSSSGDSNADVVGVTARPTFGRISVLLSRRRNTPPTYGYSFRAIQAGRRATGHSHVGNSGPHRRSRQGFAAPA